MNKVGVILGLFSRHTPISSAIDWRSDAKLFTQEQGVIGAVFNAGVTQNGSNT